MRLFVRLVTNSDLSQVSFVRVGARFRFSNGQKTSAAFVDCFLADMEKRT